MACKVRAWIVENARHERLEALLRELDELGCGWQLDLAQARLECRTPRRHGAWARAGSFAGLLSAYSDCVLLEGGAPARPRHRVDVRPPGGERWTR